MKLFELFGQSVDDLVHVGGMQPDLLPDDSLLSAREAFVKILEGDSDFRFGRRVGHVTPFHDPLDFEVVGTGSARR